jgi:phosphoglycolate phosphatase-like HAD superfamily hydrolase
MDYATSVVVLHDTGRTVCRDAEIRVKVANILNTAPQYTIFIDLDGVLADFEKKARESLGADPRATDKMSMNELFRKLEQYQQSGGRYFEEMDLLPDAMQLWQHVKKYNPIICSAIGRITNAEKEKRNWVNHHLGPAAEASALFVPSAKEKCRHAGPNHVLIDDKLKAITPWVQAGGIGILHSSAALTIHKLKELGV